MAGKLTFSSRRLRNLDMSFLIASGKSQNGHFSRLSALNVHTVLYYVTYDVLHYAKLSIFSHVVTRKRYHA